MKKLTAVIAVLITGLVMLGASPLPWGLDSSFDIEWLLENNYELELVDDDMIEIAPPSRKISMRDAIIDDMAVVTMPESDAWICLCCYTDSYYDAAYDYVARDYGEGTNEKNTRFLLERYGREPSEEAILQHILAGDIGEYIVKAYSAMAILELFEDEAIEHVNMWNTDAGLIIFTLSVSDAAGIMYINGNVLDDMLSSLLGLGLLEGLSY